MFFGLGFLFNTDYKISKTFIKMTSFDKLSLEILKKCLFMFIYFLYNLKYYTTFLF